MSSRGAVIKNGHITTDEYKTIKEVEGAKVLVGKNGNHGLPDYSHTPNRKYIKENKDGSFRELRDFDKDRNLILEIGYHGEINLTGNRHVPVLHYHFFDKDLRHLKAQRLMSNSEIYKKYKRILERYGL